jgi:hypothetical protein
MVSSAAGKVSMRRIAGVLAFLIGFTGISAAAAAEAVIGGVVRCEGTCLGISDGISKSLTGGAPVRLMETVTTGEAGRLELRFADDTRLTVGEKATILLDEFVFDPNGTSRFHAAITGPFRYISAKLGAGATRQASITTPLALIGVRGTDFWGGPSNGVTGIVVFEGSVEIITASGSVILSAPGEGTSLTAPGVPPSLVSRWSQDRIAAAIASVTFH